MKRTVIEEFDTQGTLMKRTTIEEEVEERWATQPPLPLMPLTPPLWKPLPWYTTNPNTTSC